MKTITGKLSKVYNWHYSMEQSPGVKGHRHPALLGTHFVYRFITLFKRAFLCSHNRVLYLCLCLFCWCDLNYIWSVWSMNIRYQILSKQIKHIASFQRSKGKITKHYKKTLYNWYNMNITRKWSRPHSHTSEKKGEKSQNYSRAPI